MNKSTLILSLGFIFAVSINAAEQTSKDGEKEEITHESPFDYSKLASNAQAQMYERIWQASLEHVKKHVEAIKHEYWQSKSSYKGWKDPVLTEALVELNALKKDPSYTIENQLAIPVLKKHRLMNKENEVPILFVYALGEVYPRDIIQVNS